MSEERKKVTFSSSSYRIQQRASTKQVPKSLSVNCGQPKRYFVRCTQFGERTFQTFQQLLQNSPITTMDITLSCGREFVRAHQNVLKMFSLYFQLVLKEADCDHPVIALKGICIKTLISVLRYMYHGRVVLEEMSLPHFLQALEYLSIPATYTIGNYLEGQEKSQH